MNLVGTIADAVTGAYLLGRTKIQKSEADQILYSSGIINSIKKKEIEGHEVYMQVVPKGSSITTPKDFKGENTFGAENGEMVKIIDREFGRDAAVNSINKAFALGTNYLSRRGYTLALQDLNVSDKVKKMTSEIIEVAEKKTSKVIEDYNSGNLEHMPGKTLDETRETKILQILNEVRTEVAGIVKANFPIEGNVNKMITPGAAGSMLNITQIGCCVGQQSLWSKRINFGYT